MIDALIKQQAEGAGGGTGKGSGKVHVPYRNHILTQVTTRAEEEARPPPERTQGPPHTSSPPPRAAGITVVSTFVDRLRAGGAPSHGSGCGLPVRHVGATHTSTAAAGGACLCGGPVCLCASPPRPAPP